MFTALGFLNCYQYAIAEYGTAGLLTGLVSRPLYRPGLAAGAGREAAGMDLTREVKMRKPVLLILALVAALGFGAPVKAAGIGSTLGVFFSWDIEETQKAFAKAGIPEASNVNPKLREMVTGMVKTLGEG